MITQNTTKHACHVYGPVPSRRLGRSLGIDLVPFKTCTYDCIYCQLGRTTHKTVKLGEWWGGDEIIDSVQARLATSPDVITLAGSGEPALYSNMGMLITRLKEVTDIPIAVITNGSLLWKPEIRKSLMRADLVIPSLDAGNEYLFKYINRPHPQITFNKMLEGLIQFRQEYTGEYWLEVFLLAGVTTVKAEVKRLADCIYRIEPDRVQVNSVTRPPCESFATAVPENQLEQIARDLYYNVEVIMDFVTDDEEIPESGAQKEDIIGLLQRRPCSLNDIASGLSLHPQDVVKILAQLKHMGQVQAKQQNGAMFYVLS